MWTWKSIFSITVERRHVSCFCNRDLHRCGTKAVGQDVPHMWSQVQVSSSHPTLLGCFLLQNYHISFLLVYPAREENTLIWLLLASIRYKYKIYLDLIFHLFLTQPTNRGSAPGSLHPQCSEKHIWCGYCWGWSPVVEVNAKSDVLSADCMIFFQDDLHWSVKRYTEVPKERKDFHRAVLGAPKITNISSFSSDMEHSLSWRQTVILFFCIIYSECT